MALHIVKENNEMCMVGFLPHAYKVHYQHDRAMVKEMDIYSEHNNCTDRKKLFFTNNHYSIQRIFVKRLVSYAN